MPTRRITLPGAHTGRRAPVDRGYVHWCAETCIHIKPFERALAEQLMIGKSNREIAASLNVSYSHVRNTLTRLYVRMGVSSRIQLALFVAQALIPGKES